MRILFVTSFYPPLSFGGTQLYTHGIAQELMNRGHQVRVICAGKWDEGAAYLSAVTDSVYEGVQVCRLDLNWTKAPDPFRYLYDNPVTAAELGKLIADFRPQVVHATSCSSLSASAVFTAKQAAIPVVLTLADFWFICPRFTLLHADGHICDASVAPWECMRCLASGAKVYRWSRRVFPNRLLRPILSWIGKWPWLSRQRGLRGMIGDMDGRRTVLRDAFEAADVVLSISQYVKDGFSRSGQMPAEKIQGHEWGLPEYSDQPRAVAEASDPLRIAYFGRVAPGKGIEVLLRAFKQIQGDTRLSVYGSSDGGNADYDTHLQRIAGGDDRIVFTGPYRRSEMRNLLAETDVVVFPSVWPETYGLVPREAFLARVPVVASRIGAIPAFVKHKENGLLFEPGNIDELTAQLQLLLDQPTLRSRLVEHISSIKSVGQECDELVAIYEELALRVNA